MYRDTYAEINLKNIAFNINSIIKKYNSYEYYFGVIKGNAYGHGMGIIPTLIKNGINYLAVSSLDEALEARNYNKSIPILCLEPIDIDYIDVCSTNNITLTVDSLEYVKKLINFNNKIKIHIKIDTGMNRLGFKYAKELENSLKLLKANKYIEIEGIYTHIGTLGISDPYRDKQISKFNEITKLIDLNCFKIVHIDRSVTMMCHQKIQFCNGVRIGISLYGYNQIPIKKTGLVPFLKDIKAMIRIKRYKITPATIDTNIKLSPALNLYSKVISIKKVNVNELVGYGCAYKAEVPCTVATVCIGYADGIDLRSTGNYVFINGNKYKIIGTINMGMISVEVDKNVKINDKVEIYGKHISVRDCSKHIGTTVYETMTSISPLIERKYVK